MDLCGYSIQSYLHAGRPLPRILGSTGFGALGSIGSALAILGSWVAARGRLGGRVILHEARSAESRWPRGQG